MIIQFLSVAAALITAVSATSLFWPYVRTEPVPEPLDTVRETILSTSIGKNIIQSLNLAEKPESTVDVNAMVQGAMTTAVDTVKQKAEDAVTIEFVKQVVAKIEAMGPEEKEFLHTTVCQ